jgi:hypothetical protein
LFLGSEVTVEEKDSRDLKRRCLKKLNALPTSEYQTLWKYIGKIFLK